MVGVRSTIGNSGFNTTGRSFVVEDESKGSQKPLPPNQIPQDRLINPSVAQG